MHGPEIRLDVNLHWLRSSLANTNWRLTSSLSVPPSISSRTCCRSPSRPAASWVVVRPKGATGLLLARADGETQAAVVGRQFAGRVGFSARGRLRRDVDRHAGGRSAVRHAAAARALRRRGGVPRSRRQPLGPARPGPGPQPEGGCAWRFAGRWTSRLNCRRVRRSGPSPRISSGAASDARQAPPPGGRAAGPSPRSPPTSRACGARSRAWGRGTSWTAVARSQGGHAGASQQSPGAVHRHPGGALRVGARRRPHPREGYAAACGQHVSPT